MPRGGSRTGAGRPCNNPEEGKMSTLINIRINNSDLEKIKKKAEERGMTVSQFLRDLALNA